MLDTMKSLYDREGVFETDDPVEISERSSRITLADAYNLLNAKKKIKNLEIKPMQLIKFLTV